jgi:signal peptidase I
MSRILKYAVAGAGALLLASIPVKVFMGPYHSVTSSMENTIRAGKHVFATSVFSRIERNDILVFEYPPDNSGLYLFRCVGLPGEQLQIKQRDVFINNQRVSNPAQAKFMYLLETQRDLPRTFFSRKGYAEYATELPNNRYLLNLTPAQAAELDKLDFIRISHPNEEPQSFTGGNCFPHSPLFSWSADDYGPLVIPRQGWTVDLTGENVHLYGKCIQDHEGLTRVTLENDTLCRDGKPLTRHTFGQDYYFLLGDNRNNAQNSRYWGFVPDDHVQAKVWWHTDLF